jgi:hypothetical protein
LVWCLAERGEFAEGIAKGEAGVRIAEELQHPYTGILADLGVGRVRLYQGALNMAISGLERGLSLCRVGASLSCSLRSPRTWAMLMLCPGASLRACRYWSRRWSWPPP